VAVSQVIPFPPALGFRVADHGFDGAAPFEQALNFGRDAALLSIAKTRN